MARTIEEICQKATPATIERDAEEAAQVAETAPDSDKRYLESLFMLWDAVHPGRPFPGSPAAKAASAKR